MLLRSTATLVLLALASAPALAAEVLVNPSFEDGLEGWTVEIGATNGPSGAASEIEFDKAVSRDGDASLRCVGTASTIKWRMLTQTLDVGAGDLVSLRVAARCEKVTREGNQYANANGLLIFQDAGGKRLAFRTTSVMQGDRDWIDLGIDTAAPPGTARVKVGVFHSMSGTTWFDDVRFTATPTEPFDEAARVAALVALEGYMTRTYSFWGYEGKPADPAALFAKHRDACVSAADKAAFAGALKTMLAELDDVHVKLQTPLGWVATAKPGEGATFPLHAVLARLDEKIVHGRNVLAGWIGKGDDRVGYLLVASFELPPAELALMNEALDAFRAVKRVVVDVRPNGGGREGQGVQIAARFTDADVVYARNMTRDPTLARVDGFLPPGDRILPAAAPVARIDAQAAVLAGPGCVSSAEGFLLMAKALPNMTIVGRPSRGASGNPAGLLLAEGVTVWTSRWRALDLEGECIEGRGVLPDVVVEPVGVTRQGKKDPVLDAALELLRE